MRHLRSRLPDGSESEILFAEFFNLDIALVSEVYDIGDDVLFVCLSVDQISYLARSQVIRRIELKGLYHVLVAAVEEPQ